MMSYEITSRDVTVQDYPIPYVFTESSKREETDKNEIIDWLFSALMRQGWKNPVFYRSLLSSIEIDSSSVRPHFEPINRTSLIEEYFEEILLEEPLEYDIIVRMPPVKEYTMWVKVKSVEKATPRIVEPEGF